VITVKADGPLGNFVVQARVSGGGAPACVTDSDPIRVKDFGDDFGIALINMAVMIR